MSKFVNPTKVITGPNTRWSYANVWEAKSINGSTPKFSVSLIIPKTDTATIEKINRAIKAAYEEGQSKLRGNSKFVPDLESLKLPLRDGDKERKGDPAYAGCMFINANSSTAPGIVDADCNPILAPRTISPLTTMRTSCPETKKPGGRVMSSAARHERNDDNDHI